MQATTNVTVTIAGQAISSTSTRSAESGTYIDPVVPPGEAGTLTGRTDNDTGEATLGSGHGITDGMTVDVHWDGGVRYGMTVGTVAGTTVPVDGGAGDNLPSTSTPIVVSPANRVNVAIDGDEVDLVAMKLETTDASIATQGHVAFYDADNILVAALPLTANRVKLIDVAGGDANPLTGDPITYAMVSNAHPTSDAVLKMGILQDPTP